MDSQNWITVTSSRCRKSKKKYSQNERYNVSSVESCPVLSKHISSDSIQSLIRTRIEMKITQYKADILCSFPPNTFKNIESCCLIPNEEQINKIQQHFNVQLNIITSA